MSQSLSTKEQVLHLLARSRKRVQARERIHILDQLIDLYNKFPSGEEDLARKIRQAFLITLKEVPQIIKEERFSSFLAEHIEPGDFAELQWQMPETVIEYYELLYGFRFRNDAMAEHIHSLQQNLLSYALQQYEREEAYEKMFQLLNLAPTSAALTDSELQRLRNRAYLYEMRRVRRHRRWLYAYLILQVVLIVVVFPWLFVSAENGAIQQQIEQATKMDLPEEARRFFSYWDGLYWSIITAASIGYGDITPITRVGRIIAAILGIMGVITVGVIAGLILDLISPCSID